MIRWFCIALAALLVSCGQPENARVQVLIGGTLIDGKGGDPVEHAVVIVEDSKFLAAGSQTHVPIPAGSKKINTAGYIMRPSVRGGTIAAGEPANLELVNNSGSVERKMNLGQWQ